MVAPSTVLRYVPDAVERKRGEPNDSNAEVETVTGRDTDVSVQNELPNTKIESKPKRAKGFEVPPPKGKWRRQCR